MYACRELKLTDSYPKETEATQAQVERMRRVGPPLTEFDDEGNRSDSIGTTSIEIYEDVHECPTRTHLSIQNTC